MPRNSFVQMSKLTNLNGRTNYISSHARQENLYAVYNTTNRKFWNVLARCNQEEFAKSGTDGKCIEARELIIALPENFTKYKPDVLLKLFTEHFKQNYGTECIAALHHNKKKTNYHIHLIFSERRLLERPIEKIASRNMFYDENGKHVRTKKEITDGERNIKNGCRVIQKGEVYERKLFTVKDSRFKSEHFLDEVKHSYTNLINFYVKDAKEQLRVFERNGVYLPMRKIGKNNPKAEEVRVDNEVRKSWNQTVDRALVSGVPEGKILKMKHTEISEKVRESVSKNGRQPRLFATIVKRAIDVLELLITRIFKLALRQEKVQPNEMETKPRWEVLVGEKKPEQPRMSPLAEKYPRLSEVHGRLEKQNYAIYQREQRLSGLERELTDTKGIFKGKERKELQKQIEELKPEIENMKNHLSNIVKDYGYKTVKEFLEEHSVAKSEYATYKKAVADWGGRSENKTESERVKERVKNYRQRVKNNENGKQRTRHHLVDRDAR